MKNLSIALLLVLLLFGMSTIIIVDETEQIVILQFGKPVRTLKEPGLNWKLPAPLQTSNSFENRLLEYDVPPEEVLSKEQIRRYEYAKASIQNKKKRAKKKDKIFFDLVKYVCEDEKILIDSESGSLETFAMSNENVRYELSINFRCCT